jgi:hypothetical protein
MNAAASAKCITEEILAHVGDDNDEITSGTLIRVIQVWFGKLREQLTQVCVWKFP